MLIAKGMTIKQHGCFATNRQGRGRLKNRFPVTLLNSIGIWMPWTTNVNIDRFDNEHDEMLPSLILFSWSSIASQLLRQIPLNASIYWHTCIQLGWLCFKFPVFGHRNPHSNAKYGEIMIGRVFGRRYQFSCASFSSIGSAFVPAGCSRCVYAEKVIDICMGEWERLGKEQSKCARLLSLSVVLEHIQKAANTIKMRLCVYCYSPTFSYNDEQRPKQFPCFIQTISTWFDTHQQSGRKILPKWPRWMRFYR